MFLPSEIPESLHRTDFTMLRIGARAEDVAWKLLNDEANVESITALKKGVGLEAMKWRGCFSGTPPGKPAACYFPNPSKLGTR